MFESPPVAEFVDEVEVIGGFEHLDVLNNAGVALNRLQNFDFVDRALFELWVLLKLQYGDDLHCELLVGLQVRGFVDCSVHAFPDNFDQRIVFNNFPPHRANNYSLVLANRYKLCALSSSQDPFYFPVIRGHHAPGGQVKGNLLDIVSNESYCCGQNNQHYNRQLSGITDKLVRKSILNNLHPTMHLPSF